MKTLFLTDLDGTFLNSKAEVTEKSASIINELIQKGVLFTLSTARTHATVLEMFSHVKLNVPLVLMNGVLIFDPVKKVTVSTVGIDRKSALLVLDIFKKHKKEPMLYYENNGKLRIYYKDLANKYQQDYINNRSENSIKEFFFNDSPTLPQNGESPVYIVTLDPYDKLKEIYEEVSKIEALNCMFYRDNYTNCYFLEIMSKSVSKGTGALKVKELVGADRIVAFGDNLNDIPIFEVADESYAVSNAHDNLKKMATGVIGSNDEDAVALFILQKVNESAKE